MKDPWEVLRIPPTRDLGKIKAAYRVRAQKSHPDKAPTVEGKRRCTLYFIELREAYTHAKFRAQYESDLQPLRIRRPPDLSENALLSNDWFLAAVVVAASLFGFWLIWVSAEHVPHYTVHTLSVVQAGLVFAWARIQAFGSRHAEAGSQRNGLQRFASFASRLQACARKWAVAPAAFQAGLAPRTQLAAIHDDLTPSGEGRFCATRAAVCQPWGFLLHCISLCQAVRIQWWWRRSPRDDML